MVTVVAPQSPDSSDDSLDFSVLSMLRRQRYFTRTQVVAYRQCTELRGGSHCAGSRSPLLALTLSVTATSEVLQAPRRP